MSETGAVVEENFGGCEEVQPVEEIVTETTSSSMPDIPNSASANTNANHPTSSSTSAPSSPPPDDRIFSSDVPQEDESELSSAPSSPPEPPSLPQQELRKSVFSSLKRKRTAGDNGSAVEPLADITPNARKRPRLRRKSLTQMKIDLGGEVRKSCRACGMEYVPSVKEDSAIHSKFCAMNVGGMDMGKRFLKDDSVKRVHSEGTEANESAMVVTVDRKASLAARNKTRKVLEVVNAELSSADIDDEHLWGARIPDERLVEIRRCNGGKADRREDRFKVFLYLVNDKCVGFCLSERIKNAFQVVPSLAPVGNQIMSTSQSSSISVATTADVALLGISRIWTSKAHRGHGIAVDLLDCARKNFFYGVEAPKNLVAFSQPTESGARLAERWFEARTGWHVYRGEQ